MEVNILLLAAVLALLAYLYRSVTRNNDYFHDKPIPSLAVKPLFGSTAPLLLKRASFNGFIQSIYDKFPNVKVFGMFDALTPVFVIRDPELIKKIAVKDFEYFLDHRPMFSSANDESNDHPLALFQKSLFSMNGQRWKNTRITLSPAFTGSKMRQMFVLMSECCEVMVKHFKQRAMKSSGGQIDVEVKDMMARIGVDVIGSCAFGIKVDCFKDQDNEFLTQGRKMMNFGSWWFVLKMMLIRIFPKLASWYGIDMLDREQAEYFTRLLKDAINNRVNQGVVRHDMVDLLLQARKGTLKHQKEQDEVIEEFATIQEYEMETAQALKPLTESEMIAQCLVFFLGGFDTISTTIMFVVYELIMNPEIQEKLYEEIVKTNEDLGGKPLTYETLQGMKYMDMVVTETMRYRTIVPAIDRLCVKDYVLDDGEGLRFTIEKGTSVWLPAQGLHHDPKYFPNPSKFDPERFSEENRWNIDLGTYMPFGVGPRHCIGNRFALMEVKAVMYNMLLNFSFERNVETPIPLKLQKGFAPLTPEGEMHVQLKLR